MTAVKTRVTWHSLVAHTTRVLKLTVFQSTELYKYVLRKNVKASLTKILIHALFVFNLRSRWIKKVSFYDLIKSLCIEDRRYWSNVCESV